MRRREYLLRSLVATCVVVFLSLLLRHYIVHVAHPQLVRAIEAGDSERVITLLQRGADPDEGGLAYRPLVSAAERNQVVNVQALLAYGADPDARVPDNMHTALETAAKYGHQEVVEVLLASGARPEGLYGPLHLAADVGSSAVVGTLLDDGADPTALDSMGRQPWERAMGAGHTALASRLLRAAGQWHGY